MIQMYTHVFKVHLFSFNCTIGNSGRQTFNDYFPFQKKNGFVGIVFGKLTVRVHSHVVNCSYISCCPGTLSQYGTCVETQIFQTPSKISWGLAVLKNRTSRCEWILLPPTLLAREEENHPPQIWQLDYSVAFHRQHCQFPLQQYPSEKHSRWCLNFRTWISSLRASDIFCSIGQI